MATTTLNKYDTAKCTTNGDFKLNQIIAYSEATIYKKPSMKQELEAQRKLLSTFFVQVNNILNKARSMLCQSARDCDYLISFVKAKDPDYAKDLEQRKIDINNMDTCLQLIVGDIVDLSTEFNGINVPHARKV